MSIIKNRKIWFIFSGAAVAASIFLFVFIGLDLGLDFTGGSLMELELSVPRPTNQQINAALSPLKLGDITIQPIGENDVVLRFKEIDEDNHQKILESLKTAFRPENQIIGDGNLQIEMEVRVLKEKRFDSIGPTIGQELQKKTVWAIIMVIAAIIIYIAWAFRKISKPVASWKYGLIATIALFHDIIITIGVFVVLGKLYGFEVNAPFVAALLTILGYSVNDTIVVFDRTRENLLRRIGEDFEDIVDQSVKQVITRSINASLTTLLVLFSILLLGGQSIRDFALALIVGITIGTYSSIFLASPLLVVLEKIKIKK